MDFDANVPWHHPLSWMNSLPSRADVNQQQRQQRKTFPEIHFMKILEKQAGGKFKLEAPWGGVLDRVPCTDFNIVSLLEPDMIVAVRYDIVARDNPYIRNLAPSKVGVPSEIVIPEPPVILSGSWLQFRGLHGLGYANSGTMPDLTATSTTLWSYPGETAIGTPLGALLTDAALWIAYGIRNVANTAWTHVELARIEDETTATYLTASYSSSAPTLGGFDGMWMSENGDLLFAWIFGTLTLFRKRFLLWEAVTVSTPTRGSLAALNISESGVLVQGIYSRVEATCTLSDGTLGGTLSFGSQDEVNGGDIEAWNLHVAGTSIAQEWAVDPVDIWGTDYILTSMNTGGKLPVCGNGFVVATTARPKLVLTGLYERALAVEESTLPGPPPYPADGAAYWSSTVGGKLTCLSSANGETLWEYTITANATTPVTDASLYDPVIAFCELFDMGEFTEGVDTIVPNFGGVLSEDQILHAIDEGGDGIGTSRYGSYPVNLGDFTGPRYGFFRSSSVLFLPVAGRNTEQPTHLDETNLRNSDAFVQWPIPLASQDGTMIEASPEIVSNGTDVYAAYLTPVNMFLGGGPGRGLGPSYPGFGYGWVGVFNGALATYTGLILDEFGDPYGYAFDIPFARFVTTVYERKLVKVRNGAATWTADISQRMTMSFRWIDYEAVDLDAASGIIYGQDSADDHLLADNVWKIVPYRRVVFVVLDNHVLGASFQPVVELQVHNDATGALLHTVPLLYSASVLTDPIYEQIEETESFTYEASRDFELSHVASSIVSVLVNGSPVGYTVISNDPVTTVRLDNEQTEGDAVDITYNRNGDITYLAGDYVYEVNPDVTIRATGEEDAEVCVVLTTQTNRETGATVNHAVRVEMAAGLATAPTVSTSNVSSGAVAPLTIGGGNAYFFGFDTNWNVQRI